jgi:transposase-like protein
MTQKNIEVTETKLAYAKEKIDELEAKVEELEKWKNSCTKIAMWWMGFAAATLTIVGFIQAKFDSLFHIAEKLK